MTTLRVATAADVERLLRFIEAYYTHDHLAFEATTMRQALLDLLGAPELGRACVIEHGGDDVGYTVLTFGFDAEFGGRLATVTDFYLEPAGRAQGVGAAAVAEVEKLCRSLGVKAIELHVIRGNDRALAFWTRRGWARLDRIPMSKTL